MPVRTTGELLAGRYRVERRLGAGGMATVFLAHDERLGRPVALKRLHADSPEDVSLRFRREAKVGASLNHPNVVAVYDTVTDDEGVLIVMEYVEGRTLRDEIAAGRLSPERTIEVLAGVADALDHAHEHGVIHRDVKPANVLISDRGGLVKLADLGIASAAEHTKITLSGTVLGTASYMAPERLDGRAGGPEVDVYALAAVAFEALSGQKAFTGSTAMEIARRIATQEPPDLADLVPGTPPRAAEVLRRALAKDPDARPPSAGQFVRELSGAYADAAREAPRTATASTRAVAGAPVPPPPPPPPARAEPYRAGRGSRRAPLAVLALLAAIAAIVAIAALGSGGGSSTTASKSTTSGRSKRHGSQPQPRAARHQTQAPPAAATAGGPGAATPQAAVTGFYERGLQGDYQGAWALATDNARNQVRGFDSFKQQEQTLKSIAFPQLNVANQTATAATVQFQSIAQHTDGTDNCNGTFDTVKAAGGWLLDGLHVTCNRQASGPPAGAGPQQSPPGDKGPKGGKHKGQKGGQGGGGD